MRGFAPARRGSFDRLRTGSFVSARGPKTIGARAWPQRVPLPQSRLLGLPSTSGALRLTLRMNGLSLPAHAFLPFVLSVALAKSKGAQTVLAPTERFRDCGAATPAGARIGADRKGKACGLHGRQPMGMGIVFTLHDVEEGLLEQIRDGAAFSGSDLPVVDFPNRRHFGGCSREEHFLGHV